MQPFFIHNNRQLCMHTQLIIGVCDSYRYTAIYRYIFHVLRYDAMLSDTSSDAYIYLRLSNDKMAKISIR